MPSDGATGLATKRSQSAPTGTPDSAVLIAALKEQWPSMAGMAFMFILTIVLAMIIQPTYDYDELRAFGADGATKASFILMEGVMILVFTFVIIWMAKKNLQKFIQVGMWAVLWIALLYTLVPLAHMVMTPDTPGMEPTEIDGGSTILATANGGETVIALDLDGIMVLEGAGTAGGPNGGAEMLWNTNITPENGSSNSELNVLVQETDFVLCESSEWRRIDLASGAILENHSDDCQLGLTVLRDGEQEAWAIIYNGILVRVDEFHPNNPPEDWRWKMPESFDAKDIILAQKIGENHFLVVTGADATVVEIPDDRHANDLADPIPNVTTMWTAHPDSGERFIAATFGFQVGHAVNDSSDTRAFYIGSSGSSVQGYNINLSNGVVNVEANAALFDERNAFEGPIRGLLLADCCHGGAQDLWVLDGEDIEVYMGRNLIDRSRPMKVAGSEPVNLALSGGVNLDWEDRNMTDGIIVVETVPMDVEAGWTKGTWVMPPREDVVILGAPMMWADVVGVLLSIALLVGLVIHPEWYLVNLFGILVGAGVSTMLGVSFVPWLVILFMVGMSFYDHWAVNKSKHMLDLADTMIDLKLPILLVAPKDRHYSFIDEGGDVMAERAESTSGLDQTPQPVKASAEMAEVEGVDLSETSVAAAGESDDSVDSPLVAGSPDFATGDRFEGMQPTAQSQHGDEGSAEAMFMGLGDVIFPGILVISALTWLPEGTSMLGFGSGPLMVAIGTLIGGLLGYFALMTRVAMGKPQAGLPLLCGGSILGYLISVLIFIGPVGLVFNITLF